MSLHRLEPPPVTVRFLTNEQSAKVNDLFPNRSPYRCQTCLDTKRFRWYVPETGRDLDQVGEYECSCADQFKLHRRFLHSGILEAYQRLSWDDYTWASQSVIDAAADYLENADSYMRAGLGLCLWGPRGNGKTMAAMLLAKQLVVDGHSVFAQNFAALLDSFADGWKDKADRVWFNERVRNASFLVVDDIGRERNKGPEALGTNALEEVLRHRVNRNLPTIVTTNLTPDELRAGYGGHTASLMTEKVIMVETSGHDRRGDKALRDAAEVKAGLSRPVMM